MGWPDRRQAALSLSFDDARPSQLRCGLPLLERLGVPATFFVLPNAVEGTVTEWRDAVAGGHEIGNHTMTHPCSRRFAWSRGNAVEQMSVADYRSEVCEANRRLLDLLGIEPTVFAYPCGDTFVGEGRSHESVVPLIAEMFDVGRTFNDVVANSPADLDPSRIACVNSDEQPFAALLPALEAAAAAGAWLVLGGHEIGFRVDEHETSADDDETTWVETIEAVVSWCQRNGVWIDTIGNVARAAATFKAG
jgi:peptidoglycan/xylan/chitin deacetylase (PgdA/CDA1 family)